MEINRRLAIILTKIHEGNLELMDMINSMHENQDTALYLVVDGFIETEEDKQAMHVFFLHRWGMNRLCKAIAQAAFAK